jgi:hypothetical protein
MIFTVIAAVVLVIAGRPAEAIVFPPILLVGILVSPFVLARIPGTLEAVLRRPPADVGAHIAALERSLTDRSLFRIGPILQARVKLMALYKQQNRLDEAIFEAKEILARERTSPSSRGQFHLEIAPAREVSTTRSKN